MKRNLFRIVMAALLAVSAPAAFADGNSSEGTKTITDMAGRTIVIPSPVRRVLTIGAVYVENGFIDLMGGNGTIMNDLPASATQWQRKFQYIIAPSLKGEPVLQSTNTDLNIEEVEKAKPDLVFTMNPSDADTLGKWGIKVAVMRSMNADDIKKWSSLVGEIYNRQDRATEYNEYFNTTVRQAEERVSQIPAEQRPKVLYIKYTLMTSPHQIIEYAIREAGGKSVSAISFGQETATGVNQQIIGPEQIVQWDPEIMIVESAQEVAAVYDDARISSVKAVKNKNVYCTPVGAHLWTHEGLEEPLCILWLQNLLYPEKYSRSDLEKDTSAFFREFFGTALTAAQVDEILNGAAHL